ncbi:BPK_HP2_G0024650.mRNA.1.CDS.1 [Saccharomyces cerevisiae]|nr:BPK_HP2_G0024650.mRNA.1.CDS.1 [Saccharomyces cerevisiae]CAI6452977.1 BPK_HP2_G0024650.mRNA.1.CDS.1 [Saccharomyces cerevisiae]CAI7234535.1 CGH_3_collapsed_G0025810.mRNA.1.CDS.1 [Saccharomyces cerevisiae]
MPADAYAKQLVKDILSTSDPVDVYRGTFANIMRFVMIFVPYWLLEKGLSKKFKLDKVNNALKSKQKNKDD